MAQELSLPLSHMFTRLLKYRSRIGTRIALAITVSLMIGAVAFVYFAHRTGQQVLDRQANAKGHGIAQFGRVLLEHLMLESRAGHLDQLLRAAQRSGQAANLFVLRTDGSVAFSTDASLDHLPIQQFSQSPQWPDDLYLMTEERDTLFRYVISPIPTREECYRCHDANQQLRGFFGAKISMADLAASASEHRTTNVLITIVVFLGVGVLIFSMLYVLVTRPLSLMRTRISNATEKLTSSKPGDPLVLPQLPFAGTDEIGEVVSSFNNLSGRFNQAQESVRRLHQLQLEHADRLTAAGKMAASIAHEIRNPMAGVHGALQVLYGEAKEDDPHKAILREMIHQLERMNDSLTDLLTYAKPASPEFVRTNIHEILDRTLLLLASRPQSGRIRIEKEYDSRLPSISGDPRMLQQVFWNLILNAVQAMPTEGVLNIRTELQSNGSAGTGPRLIIRVRDTGIGIPSADLENIFRPFHTGKHQGTGLGLAVCQQIVQQHQGTITVQSQEGRGTVFEVVLPTDNGKPASS